MTRHPSSPNRLAAAASPYLLQHAHNPVQWHPWDEEALTLARTLDRPIFLSIGYSACHWCHVMERESFADPTVAHLLNREFVPIKVDREERPDVDGVYMAAVQAMTGSGGWPLSVFLTPDLQPFFGGTYFPPERRWGRPSFVETLESVADAWRQRREEVADVSSRLTAQLAAWGRRTGSADVAAPELRRRAVAAIAESFDADHGGFTPAPKFPSPSRLLFLLGMALEGHSPSRTMLTATLDAMAAGGMFDWVGGGFHRYSVDRAWLVPHFEKMLYDNALLARVYGAAGVALAEPRWCSVARETAEYLLREMQSAPGGFYSATDADSEGHEGRFFTWTPAELRAALPPDQAELIADLCAVEEAGNFEDGRTILRPTRSLEALADRLGVPLAEASAQVQSARSALLAYRSRRTPPALDDKLLAGWNGMAMWALAYLGAALPEPRYLVAAQRAGAFILAELVGSGTAIVRSWRRGRRSGVETLEDLAWVAAGLVELFQADGNPDWLGAADDLVRRRLPRYLGSEGQVFDTPDDGAPLPIRLREAADGALPAPAGVLVQSLVRLSHLTGAREHRDSAAAALRAEGGLLSRAPEACLTLLDAATLTSSPPLEVVLIANRDDPAGLRMLGAAHRAGRPLAALVPPAGLPVPEALAAVVPLLRGREEGGGPAGPWAYVCAGGSCTLPIRDEEGLLRALTAGVAGTANG